MTLNSTRAGDVFVGDTIALPDGSQFHITAIEPDGNNVEFDGWREWDGGNADHIVNYADDFLVSVA